MDEIRITLVADDIKRLEEKYTKELVGKAYWTVDLYLRKIAREAQAIVKEYEYMDTGRLYSSIEADNAVIGITKGKISGELNAVTNYARFIHEGAKHESDDKIVPHFVSFKAAPSLFMWAERHNIIYRKTKTGKRANRSSNKASAAVRRLINNNWYFYSEKTEKEYPINVRKGGMMVMSKATKFFEKPFEELKEDFIKDMSALVGGIE